MTLTSLIRGLYFSLFLGALGGRENAIKRFSLNSRGQCSLLLPNRYASLDPYPVSVPLKIMVIMYAVISHFSLFQKSASNILFVTSPYVGVIR